MFADARLVRELLGLGASAFLAKNSFSRDLVSTVRSVETRSRGGENVIVSVPRADLDAGGSVESRLSHREAEVLKLVARRGQ